MATSWARVASHRRGVRAAPLGYFRLHASHLSKPQFNADAELARIDDLPSKTNESVVVVGMNHILTFAVSRISDPTSLCGSSFCRSSHRMRAQQPRSLASLGGARIHAPNGKNKACITLSPHPTTPYADLGHARRSVQDLWADRHCADTVPTLCRHWTRVPTLGCRPWTHTFVCPSQAPGDGAVHCPTRVACSTWNTREPGDHRAEHQSRLSGLRRRSLRPPA